MRPGDGEDLPRRKVEDGQRGGGSRSKGTESSSDGSRPDGRTDGR